MSGSPGLLVFCAMLCQLMVFWAVAHGASAAVVGAAQACAFLLVLIASVVSRRR